MTERFVHLRKRPLPGIQAGGMSTSVEWTSAIFLITVTALVIINLYSPDEGRRRRALRLLRMFLRR
ncbi:hypothetical protein GCM10010168_10690 [Actinoplanes ianthinogenes]|uniref:Uncharacterized protein n=1 Tax=Actinoplanes ianthinogenes TaxID=122358 RepID=A0ABN6CH33_9ACTN|nr:hypothetical protein Aiant_49130 [Actinoplanes ianthinogenes]GGQ96849.1 hypothetical protein GCM10010168_10690 [Actinoplanes ianthinogenes]